MYVVVHFEYDGSIMTLSKLKIKLQGELNVGKEVLVPWETEDIADDGTTVIQEKNYKGKIVWYCEVKKTAAVIAEKTLQQLKAGTSLDDIINENKEKLGKRDMSTKMKEAIAQLKEETNIHKKTNKQNSPASQSQDRIKKQKSANNELRKESVCDKSSAENSKRNLSNSRKRKAQKEVEGITKKTGPCEKNKISNEKLAEIAELLGSCVNVNLKPSQLTQNNLTGSSGTCTPQMSEGQELLPNESVITEQENTTTKNPNTTREILKETEERQCATPSKDPSMQEKPMTPRKSPRLANKINLHYCSPAKNKKDLPKKNPININTSTPRQTSSKASFEDISPVKCLDRWDGTFTESTNVLLDLDHPNQPPYLQPPVNSNTAKRDFICDLLGISATEGLMASKVFRKLADVLEGRESSAFNQGRESSAFNLNFNPYSATQLQQNIVQQTSHQYLEGDVDNQVYPDPYADLEYTSSSINVQSKYGGESSCMLKDNSCPKILKGKKDEKQDSNHLGPLIKDRQNPEKYSSVLVDKKKERECLLIAKTSKTPGISLLNSVLGLVFTDQELANSSGMGLKRKKDNADKPVLDALRVEAVREYVKYQCDDNKWEMLSPVVFNTTITNKIGNVKKKLKKAPILKIFS